MVATGPKGVILLSGDRHSSALYKLERPGSYPQNAAALTLRFADLGIVGRY